MTRLALEGRHGTTLEIDLCSVCRAIWFDHFEELHLTPGATLKVFGVISEPAGGPATPFPTALHCPRCNARLLLTHDRQRSTAFQYWRCDSGHGRLITFVNCPSFRFRRIDRQIALHHAESSGKKAVTPTQPD
jgi:hypothetical protein